MLDGVYGDKEPPKGSHNLREFQVSGFSGRKGMSGDEYPFIVYDFGWSHHKGRPFRAYSHIWYKGPHDPEVLKRHNKEDPRLKEAGHLPMEQIAYIGQEQEAFDAWEKKWPELLCRDDDFVRVFTKALTRERSLCFRRNVVLGHIHLAVQSLITAEQKRKRPEATIAGSSYRAQGPRVLIDGRSFFYESGNLREGEPFETHTFSVEQAGAKTAEEEAWVEWHSGTEGIRDWKTRRVREYLRDKESARRAAK